GLRATGTGRKPQFVPLPNAEKFTPGFVHVRTCKLLNRRGPLMKVIAVIGQKGGTGKTTTAQNLSVAAIQAGHTVALVDLDSQPTSANWGDRRESEHPAVVSAQVARLRN